VDTVFPNASSIQRAILRLLVMSSIAFDMGRNLKEPEAGHMSLEGAITSLSRDQWMRELVIWESQVWASFQIAVADYASGTSDRVPATKEERIVPSTSGEKALCMTQKMRKSGAFV
jgi:hypothetical protein